MNSVSRSLRIALVAALALVSVAVFASGANAAYKILDYKLTPSSTQAGGHPNFHYHVDPDAAYADKNGADDLKKVVMDFPAGLLGNPEAATSKCSSSAFANDSCPAASHIGTMKIVVRLSNGSSLDLPGAVYVLSDVSPGSAATIGFIVRPNALVYRRILLKTEATGVVSVRSGSEKDYGLTLVVDMIPRTLTTILGSQVSTTISDISVDINGRAGTPTKNSNGTYTPKGPYFVFMPTRCALSESRALITSYQNVVIERKDTFTPTGCSSVPFQPTASYAISNNNANASTGVAATFTIPTADATIQQSHVKTIQTDLPTGSRLDFPAIGNVPALCSEALLNDDACPAGSKIGTVSAAVPFLPPTMTGDVYMLSRGTSVQFGYILRGGVGNGVKAPLKGDIFVVDANNDGAADFVRAVADLMPQAPWSTATINFSTPMLRNPSTCNTPNQVKTKLTGWSGAVANLTTNWPTLNCTPDPPPIVTITSPPNNTQTGATSIPVIFSATDNSGTPVCNRVSGTAAPLVPGTNVITVTCTDVAGNSSSASVTVFRGLPPVLQITSPANNSYTTASQIGVSFTVDGAITLPSGTTCTVNGVPVTPPNPPVVPLALGANTITVVCTNVFGSGSATVVVNRGNPPVVVITAPANGTPVTTPTVNVAYTVDGAASIPPLTTCTVNGTASTSATTNTVSLPASGPRVITVTCVNPYGAGTASMSIPIPPVPTVQISSPANGTNTSASSINVAYTIDGSTTIPAGTICTVNNVASTSATTNTVALVMGANTITVICTNAFGQSAPKQVTVVRGTPPGLVITAPANNSTTIASPINVAYTIDGGTSIPSGTTCDVRNATTGYISASTSTTTNSVPLDFNVNELRVTCSNQFGAQAQTVLVNRPVDLPFPVITSPTPNPSYTTAATINVAYVYSGSTTIPAGTTCVIRNAATGSVQVSTSTATNVVNLAIGSNTISVECTNAFGTSVGSTVVVRGTPPTVTIIEPNANTPIPPIGGTINVRYLVNGSSTIPAGTTCTVNGQISTDPNNNPVPVTGSNTTITVSCTNQFGVGTATVFINIPPPPTVAITQPVDGSTTSNSLTNVAFTVNAASSIPAGTTCTVNGVPTTSATSNTVALAVGPNTINVTCTNSGGPTSRSVTVFRSTPAIDVEIVSPQDGSWTQASSVTPSLSIVNDPGTATCQWTRNGSQVSLPIPLVNGANVITVTCTAGSSSDYDTITVRRDNVAPVVTISVTPATVVGGVPVSNVSWTVTDDQDPTPANNCTLSQDGVPLPGAPHTSPRSVQLHNGANGLSVVCLDEAGNAGTSTVTIVYPGVEPPQIVITSPANGSFTSQPTINVTYLVNGSPTLPPGMTCTINGIVSSGGSNNPVNLQLGQNTITLSCSNASGSVSGSIVVTRMNVPVVNITTPFDNQVISSSSTNVSYTVNGAASIPANTTCTVNGQSSSSATTNLVDNIPIGNFNITVSCTNPVGNGSDTAPIKRMLPPVIANVSPANGSTIATSPVNVSFTVDGQSGALPPGTTCTVNGVAAPNSAVNPVVLTAGANTITIQCTNAAGVTTRPITVVFAEDVDVEIVDPQDGAWIASSQVTPTLSITSSGSVPGGITCSWTNNGAPTSPPITLVDGDNVLVVTCGNGTVSDSDQITVHHDGAPPVVDLIAELDASSGPSTFLANVVWTVTDNLDPSPACVLMQDGLNVATTSPQQIALHGGTNTFTVTCEDEAGNSASDTATVEHPQQPVVHITSPVNNQTTTAGSISVSYTLNAATTIPAGTTCTVNNNASTSAVNNSVPLSFGLNTITVSCTNSGGTGTDSVVVRRGAPPVVVITSPLPGTSTTSSQATVVFTVNGLSSIPAGTTCTVNGVISPSTVYVLPLIVGPNSITITCTNEFGTGNVTTTTIRYPIPPPETDITNYAPPSSSSTATKTVSFYGGAGVTTFECRMNNAPWSACSSPWTLPLGDPAVQQGENTYDVRVVNGGTPDPTPERGFIWVDDRPYNATASVTAEPNDITTAAQANDAGAHPNISASLSLEGYDDPRNVRVKFPDGLMGSLAAIPAGQRCTVGQANDGNCPASSQIGVATGTAESPTDGLVTASGQLYLVAPDGLDPVYAAGVAAEFDTITGPVTGDLGDIRAVGGLRLTDEARNVTVELTDLPRQTTTGNRFHVTTGDLTVWGDAGPDDSKPLITNPHFCNDDLEDFSARPNLQQFVGYGEGYDDSVTENITADYIVENCTSVPFAPVLDMELTNPVAGQTTGIDAELSVPAGNSTLRSLQVKLPPYMSLSFPSFGVSSDMCDGSDTGLGAANNVSDPGTSPAYFAFDASSCPPQSRVGSATLTTPLLDNPVTAYVYLIDKAPVPWLGLDVNPSIPGNPQGVNIGIVGFNSTPCEDGSSTPGCQQVIQSTFTSLPDVPLTSVELHLGGVEGRISNDNGTPLDPNILNVASPNASSCRNSGTVTSATFVPWSTTSPTTVTDPVLISGCNDPKVNITAPTVPTTGARINNIANTTTTSPLNFTVNGSTTIPAGVTCKINGTTVASGLNTVTPVLGVNNYSIVCTDAFGSGTATRRIDKAIPSVRIASPINGATTGSATTNVTLGVHSNGTALSSLGSVACQVSVTNSAGTTVYNFTSLTFSGIVLQPGTNTLVATCTNSFGTGTSDPVVIVRN